MDDGIVKGFGKKLSPQELKRLFAEEDRREKSKQLYGPDGKKLNARKRRGASKAIMEHTILAKLYQDGFIRKGEHGFEIDASRRIERTYMGVGTAQDIRAILTKVVFGFHQTGQNILVNGFEWEANDSGPETDRGSEPEDQPQRGIFLALQSGVCADGWQSNSYGAHGTDGGGGDTASDGIERVPNDNVGEEGE